MSQFYRYYKDVPKKDPYKKWLFGWKNAKTWIRLLFLDSETHR